jgi:hypothetical protein
MGSAAWRIHVTRRITPQEADRAFTILVRHAGARDDNRNRATFIHHVSNSSDPAQEYRFGGSLGFGGKFRNNGNNGNVPYVDCYREDETPGRSAAIIATNCALAELFWLKVEEDDDSA